MSWFASRRSLLPGAVGGHCEEIGDSQSFGRRSPLVAVGVAVANLQNNVNGSYLRFFGVFGCAAKSSTDKFAILGTDEPT